MSFAWDGLKALEGAIERVGGQADGAAKSIVARSAAVVEAAAKANFSGSHKKGEPHVGGDKPNVVTGTLRRSIRADAVTRHGLGDYGTTVGPRAVYGRRVELGWKGSKGYPFFEPAVRDVRPQLRAIAAEEWRKFLHA